MEKFLIIILFAFSSMEVSAFFGFEDDKTFVIGKCSDEWSEFTGFKEKSEEIFYKGTYELISSQESFFSANRNNIFVSSKNIFLSEDSCSVFSSINDRSGYASTGYSDNCDDDEGNGHGNGHGHGDGDCHPVPIGDGIYFLAAIAIIYFFIKKRFIL